MNQCVSCKYWHRPYAEWEKRMHFGACFRIEGSIMTDDNGAAEEYSTAKDFGCVLYEVKNEEK